MAITTDQSTAALFRRLLSAALVDAQLQGAEAALFVRGALCQYGFPADGWMTVRQWTNLDLSDWYDFAAEQEAYGANHKLRLQAIMPPPDRPVSSTLLNVRLYFQHEAPETPEARAENLTSAHEPQAALQLDGLSAMEAQILRHGIAPRALALSNGNVFCVPAPQAPLSKWTYICGIRWHHKLERKGLIAALPGTYTLFRTTEAGKEALEGS